MNTRMPCITDSDEHRFEPTNLDHARAVEDYADNLMDDCKILGRSMHINTENSIYDGYLLPSLMVEIANWTGSIESSHERMKAMHNLLADELQKIAEREVA